MSAPKQLAVLVTGATGPAGQAVTGRFDADGARVALNASHAGRLAATVDALGIAPDRLLVVPGDLTDPAIARAVVEAVEAGFGRLDVIAHMVGGWVGGRPEGGTTGVGPVAPEALPDPGLEWRAAKPAPTARTTTRTMATAATRRLTGWVPSARPSATREQAGPAR